MTFTAYKLFLITGIIGFICLDQVTAQVTVTPLGFAAALPDGEEPVGPIIISNNNEQEVTFSLSIGNNEWENDGRLLGPRRDERGGPDDMTYEWRDNEEDDCPAYDWIDITEFEDVIEIENVEDDSYHGMFDLGFDFPYYGEEYDEIGMHSNGFASLIRAEGIGFFYPAWRIPDDEGDPSPPPTMLAVNYQDLDPSRTGEIYFWTNEADMAIITWNGVSHYRMDNEDDGDPWTFQVILYGSGLVKYQFAFIGSYDNNNVLIGFQNEDRDMGFECMVNDFNYLREETVIAFGPEGAWITWLTLEPTQGEIAGGEEAEIELFLDFEDMEDGVYSADIIVNVMEEELTVYTVPVVISLGTPVGNVDVSVVNPAEDEAIADALVVMDPSLIGRFSDENGELSINELPTGEYTMTISHPDYFDLVIEGVAIEEGETTEITGEMLHAECEIAPELIAEDIGPDDQIETSFSITNNGNAPLTYEMYRRLPGGAEADPFTIRGELLIGQEVDDSFLRGVVFARRNFYVSGSHNREPVIYVLDRDGEQIDMFDQPGEDRSGMRDLAYDGTLIWGPVTSEGIYGINLRGEVQFELEAPVRSPSSIAWDPDNDYLWTCGTTTEIVSFDTDGNVYDEYNSQGLRKYGLAYWPEDPDGYNLYIYNMLDNGDSFEPALHKMDTENGDIEFVTWLETERGGSAAGAFITNQYDIYSWVMISITLTGDQAGGDRVDIWQLDSRREWFVPEPAAGEIEAGESQEISLLLDATNLVPAQYEGEIVITHDGVGGESTLPLSLNVVLGRVHSERTLVLSANWNMVSLNLQPDDDNIINIMEPLVEDGVLMLIKDRIGRFYNPEFGFNNIPGWVVSEGYQMKLSERAELTIAGETVLPDDPIDLNEGWNLIAYFPREAVDAVVALSGVADNLIIAKNGNGEFYIPEFGFTNMGDMREGQGYQLKMSDEAELVYRLEFVDEEFAGQINPNRRQTLRGLSHFAHHSNTSDNMSLLLIAEAKLKGEIGVFADDILVGSGVIENGFCGLAIWGDDLSTETVDGAILNQELIIVLYRSEEIPVETYLTLKGKSAYESDGLWVIQLATMPEIPVFFGIQAAYPNPFNNTAFVRFGLDISTEITISLHDIQGRQVLDVVKGHFDTGVHTAVIDGENLVSGVYFVRLNAGNMNSLRNLTLIK